jgi:hypothetical protein
MTRNLHRLITTHNRDGPDGVIRIWLPAEDPDAGSETQALPRVPQPDCLMGSRPPRLLVPMASANRRAAARWDVSEVDTLMAAGDMTWLLLLWL